MLLRSVGEEWCREVSEKSAVEVLEKSVVEKGGRRAL